MSNSKGQRAYQWAPNLLTPEEQQALGRDGIRVYVRAWNLLDQRQVVTTTITDEHLAVSIGLEPEQLDAARSKLNRGGFLVIDLHRDGCYRYSLPV